MTRRELTDQLEAFRKDAQAHQELLTKSFSHLGSSMGVIANIPELESQAGGLQRQLGKLRPYLEEMPVQWRLQQFGMGWNILDQAFSLGLSSPQKGISLNALIDQVQSILGYLENFPDDHIFQPKGFSALTPDLELAARLCSRLPETVRPLQHRHHGKSEFVVSDEYDVQDLLHALLRGYFKYPVRENPIPKPAGARSTRADLTIQELGLLIEAKYVRRPDDQKRLEAELAQDISFYSAWEPLKVIYFVIYNSADLEARDLLERFAQPQVSNGKSFSVRVFNV